MEETQGPAKKDERHERGRRGEDLAARYLLSRGYTLVTRNWRPGASFEWPHEVALALKLRVQPALPSGEKKTRGGMRGEIDIVAWREGVLCFVEVKTRSSNLFGAPQEAVNRAKQRQICRLANAFVSVYAIEAACRFDVIEVWMPSDNSTPRIALHLNAFDFVEG